MEWEPVTTNVMGEMILLMYKGTNPNQNRFFWEEGPSPLQVFMTTENVGEELQFEKIDEPWDVRLGVWAGGVANVVYQQPFTVYYELYYVDPAPEGASALPSPG